MSRLTHKDFDNNYYCYKTRDDFIDGYFTRENKEWFYGNVVNKLGKLEDIEEELGCPLEVVFKAMKEGIADKRFGVNYDECKLEFQKYHGYILVCEDDEYLVKDYKKTWWLRGERDVKD